MSTHTTSPAPQRRFAVRLVLAGAAGLAVVALAGCAGSDSATDVRFCALAEGSRSTRSAAVRGDYLKAFAADVEWFAKEPGTSTMCMILAVDNPLANSVGELPIRAANPNSPDADTEVAGNIEIAKRQFAEVLAIADDPVGTPLVEGLYVLAVRGDLRAGDTISIYSDMRQDSPLVKTFNLVSKRRQQEKIEAALELLRVRQLLPDGKEGRPSLAGVHIAVPAPSASVKVSRPKDPALEVLRQVAAQEFWVAWAAAVGADLNWGDPASGGRAAA